MKQINDACVTFMLISAMVVFWGCTKQMGEASAVAQNMAMIQAYVDAANRGDASYLNEYLAPDYVYHGPDGDLDADGFRAFKTVCFPLFRGLPSESKT